MPLSPFAFGRATTYGLVLRSKQRKPEGYTRKVSQHGRCVVQSRFHVVGPQWLRQPPLDCPRVSGDAEAASVLRQRYVR